MTHQSIDRKLKLFFYLFLFILLSTQVAIDNKIKNSYSIILKKIEVIGLSEENNLNVYNNLKFLLTRNIFLLKKKDFQDILNKNELIETFYIKKIYPDLLKVKLNQTNLLAITNQNNKKYYIGSNGKLIPINLIKDFNNELPFVYTKSNYNNFIILKNIIDQSQFQFQLIESFYYFPSNRWDIKTRDGFLIKLPEKNVKESLKFVQLIKESEEFKNKKIIDLRVFNNIILSNE